MEFLRTEVISTSPKGLVALESIVKLQGRDSPMEMIEEAVGSEEIVLLVLWSLDPMAADR